EKARSSQVLGRWACSSDRASRRKPSPRGAGDRGEAAVTSCAGGRRARTRCYFGTRRASQLFQRLRCPSEPGPSCGAKMPALHIEDLPEKEKLKMEVEQLRKEVKLQRQQVSKCSEEIKNYIEERSGEDPLVKGIPEDKNPFKEKERGREI
uniref:Guanine nucleotide-binding protein subunit gamma n=1 Tax=Callithrix jacchus TaxID=9483 RepID=A0A8I3X113_CALJA